MIRQEIVLIVSFVFFLSCSGKITKNVPENTTSMKNASPPCIVYKTKSDYRTFVPVIMNGDKTAIVSYPGVRDIYFRNKFSYPEELEQGFLLDNRGIGPDVAFLNITYEEYSRYEKTPTPEELWIRIIDKDPLIEMYQCGNRSDYADAVSELNDIINSGKISQWRRLK